MAADGYRATHVPVGDDQKQHVELASRHRAEVQQRLRASISSCGWECVPRRRSRWIQPATRVIALRDGTKKMSKSDPSDYSRINLPTMPTPPPRRCKAKTDPEPLPSEEKGLRAVRKPTISSASTPRLPTARRAPCCAMAVPVLDLQGGTNDLAVAKSVRSARR
jgi:tryptophanyl-tRNA synthetase